MCGIAGAVSAGGIDSAVLPKMADAIRHRGPDGLGFLLSGPSRGLERLGSIEEAANGQRPTVGFAHLRLSIIDLTEAADQPMVDESGDLALIYNGETYNYVELREELEALGHTFTSTGDSEVVLKAYAEWGPACVDRFVGMWSLALLDLRRGELFLSVDRFGIKPLYYTVAGDTLYFASEIKALLSVPEVRPEPDESIVRRYLMTGAVDDSERTFFDGIRRLRGAHNLVVPLDRPIGALAPRRYWSLPGESFEGSREEAAEQFAEMFAESIRVHLRSDVPVGTCLSGGLDSSSIVCVADELRVGGAVPHYAHMGFGYIPEDTAVSERPYMQAVVDKTALEMTYVEVPPDEFRESLVGVIRGQDEPFVSASVAAQWFVFDAARRARLKVMLDGQGADEVLGGYHSYLTLMGVQMVRNRQLLRYLRFAAQHKRLLGSPPMPLKQALGTIRMPRANGTTTSQLDGAALPSAAILSGDFVAGAGDGELSYTAFGTVHELLSDQITTNGLPALLRYEDRNSMAHSIEARVPFLDHRLVEFSFSLPDDYRIHGVRTKDMIRRGLKTTLPPAILDRRDKIGFRAEPSATWELARGRADSFLADRTPYEESWFDSDGLRTLLGSANGHENTEFMLWRALNTKLWLRTHWGDSQDPLR